MRGDSSAGRPVPASLLRAVWIGTLLLVLIGLAAALHRGLFVGDAMTRVEPIRAPLFEFLGLDDPHAADRPAELAKVDGRFAAHPMLTLLHVAAGGLFLALAPLQFVARLRERRPRLHRLCGRFLLIAALASVLPAFYFGVGIPYGGPLEAAAIALFGGLFLVALFRAVIAIRAGHVPLHREWMIRAFAVALAISTVRILASLFDPAFSPLGIRPAPLFVVTLWSGWFLTLGIAEVWIRRTRRPPSPTLLEGRDHVRG